MPNHFELGFCLIYERACNAQLSLLYEIISTSLSIRSPSGINFDTEHEASKMHINMYNPLSLDTVSIKNGIRVPQVHKSPIITLKCKDSTNEQDNIKLA